jgi:hypothetical protein
MQEYVWIRLRGAAALVLATGLVALLGGCPPNLGGAPIDAGVTPQIDSPQQTHDTLPWQIDQFVPPPDHRVVSHPDMPVGPTPDMFVGPTPDMMVGPTPDMGPSGPDATVGATCVPNNPTACTGGTPKCAVFVNTSTGTPTADPKCTTDGTVAPGGSCTISTTTVGVDDCMGSHICWVTAAGTTSGTCQNYCGADTDCTSAEACAADFGSGPTYGLCLTTCSLGSSTCGTGSSCNVDNDIDGSTSILDCQPVGKVASGSTCTYNTDCVAGNACLYSSTTATTGNCFKLCNVGGGSPGCTSPKTCMALGGSTTIGYCM